MIGYAGSNIQVQYLHQLNSNFQLTFLPLDLSPEPEDVMYQINGARTLYMSMFFFFVNQFFLMFTSLP